MISENVCQINLKVIFKSDGPVADNEKGWKDTVLVPGRDQTGNGVVRIIKQFLDFADPSPNAAYMYHCHILEHEDLGMMGQFLVVNNNVPTGINDDIVEEVAFYPNPTQNELTITLRASVSDNYTINIFNKQGTKINTLFSDFLSQGVHELRYELGSLAKGLYFLTIQSRQQAVFSRIILK